MTIKNSDFVNVDDNTWADCLSNIRVYQTEYNYGNHSIMFSKVAQGVNVGQVVAEVHYCANGWRFYYVMRGLLSILVD